MVVREITFALAVKLLQQDNEGVFAKSWVWENIHKRGERKWISLMSLATLEQSRANSPFKTTTHFYTRHESLSTTCKNVTAWKVYI